MNYLTFDAEERSGYPICFLAPTLNKREMTKTYVDAHLSEYRDAVLAYDLHKSGKRTPIAEVREYLTDLLPVLDDLQCNYLVVCDGQYFKELAGLPKAEAFLGYVRPCAVKGFEGRFQIIYCPNYPSVFYNPDAVRKDIDTAMRAMKRHAAGEYCDPGKGIIRHAEYPTTYWDIDALLTRLEENPVPLAADIETFSLKHYKAGLGTICLCWSQHEGAAFPIDLIKDPNEAFAVRQRLKLFFERYPEKIMWHRVTFDVTVVIYQLFMKDLLDTAGLLTGLEVMLKNWDCTQILTYLATNSCAGNVLGLKQNAMEFAGNYALDSEEFEDIRAIPLDRLLEYNLVDGLSTWYVFNKYMPIVEQDDQLDVYHSIFRPSVFDVIQMQLTGLPLNMEEVRKLDADLKTHQVTQAAILQGNKYVRSFIRIKNAEWVIKRNSELKKKRVTLSDAKEIFNPGSPTQLQRLLYDPMLCNLPVLDTTDTGLPAAGKDTIEKLQAHTEDQDILDLLDALFEYKLVDKLITAFLPAFLAAPMAPDGWHYLFGNFNLGGTVSGRLSSSDVNLQNLPAKGYWAGRVKICFQAPPGWIFCGLDYDSLEDKISALTTKDPNKLKVYEEGYDGHCLRAYAYFSDLMPDIDGSTVEGINAIEVKHPDLRQKSKAPTFALTYQGMYRTLMNNCGFDEPTAKKIETNYHSLYHVSDQWVDDKLNQAAADGYVTVAFGLRLRTPKLAQVIRNTRWTPFEADAEGRTAGNALGQSWGMLNNRAASETMSKVRASEHRLSIRPSAHIHDAQYYMVRDDVKPLRYLNTTLTQAVRWQEDPLIAHDVVKITGSLDVYYPSWKNAVTLPNDASESDIFSICDKHLADLSS